MAEITEYGRANGKRPKDLTPVSSATSMRGVRGTACRPRADPEEMVASRRGLGGPQPEEVSRMLLTHREKVESRWLTATRTKLSNAQDP